MTGTSCTPTCLPIESTSLPPVSIRASSRKNRIYSFREFLLKTFCVCRDGSCIVLDVAGGKGDLSWLLCNVDQIRAVIVDPRVPKHLHLQRSVAYLKDHPDEALERAVPDRPTHQPLAVLIDMLHEPYCQPQHLRILVNDDLVEALRAYRTTKSMSQWVAYWHQATQIVRRDCRDGEGVESSNIVVDTAAAGAQEALEILLKTTLVVGFHPDQATEACIDLAILLGVSYCVVPCCVFPSEFPKRLTPQGTRVRCYEELITYLQTKDPLNMKLAELGFHETATARKLVLYRNLKRTSSSLEGKRRRREEGRQPILGIAVGFPA